ncbi:MAG: hypothetical protein F4X65_05060 [Chloroflexi bacterium]|nr:hypothetical protein [Chloroflexota bacterium]
MTTKPLHTYIINTEIDYSALEFNPDDPEPLPDGMFQYPIFSEVFAVLDAHLNTLGDPETIFRSSNTFICYDRSNLNVRVGPDFYAAFDVDAHAIMHRLIYLPWEAGKPPDFVLEVASESTGRQDTINKREIYARIGIREYWRFDSTGGDYHGEPLAGEALVNGEYRRIELTTEPDGVLKGYSPTLRLWLCWQDEMLKFYDDRTGSYLMNLPDTQAALGNTQAALGEAQSRIRQLEDNLRRAQGENS